MDSTLGTIFAQAASFFSTTLRPIFRASAIDPQLTNTTRYCLGLIVLSVSHLLLRKCSARPFAVHLHLYVRCAPKYNTRPWPSLPSSLALLAGEAAMAGYCTWVRIVHKDED